MLPIRKVSKSNSKRLVKLYSDLLRIESLDYYNKPEDIRDIKREIKQLSLNR